jgi:hypothetical protein
MIMKVRLVIMFPFLVVDGVFMCVQQRAVIVFVSMPRGPMLPFPE